MVACVVSSMIARGKEIKAGPKIKVFLLFLPR